MISDPTLPVCLRALSMDDVDRTCRWHNDQALYRTLAGTFRPVSRATEESWLRHAIAPSPAHINLAICTTSNLAHIGNLYLRDIDWVSRHAELHIFIGESNARSQGYGKATVRLIQTYAAKTLGLRRLFLMVLSDNSAAVHVYTKCGFATEGRLTQHVLKDGTFKDVLIMGCLLLQSYSATDNEP